MSASISVVVPVYNEEDNLKLLHEKISEVLKNIGREFEIIYVDDSSTDNSFEILKNLKDDNTKIVKFRRNFGQTAAMQAGIDSSQGDIIITLDADLQNDPADIPKLIEKYEQGYDLVSGWRKKRQDNVIRTFPSKIANFLISKTTATGLHDTGCTLKAYNGEVLRSINLFADHHRFIPAIFAQYSNKITELEVEHHPRMYGKSKYNIFRVFRVIVDLLAIAYWRKYKSKPMYFWGFLALAFLLIALVSFVLLILNLLIFKLLLLNIVYSVSFVLFLLSSLVSFAVGLIFESILKVNLAQNKTRYYTIETVL